MFAATPRVEDFVSAVATSSLSARLARKLPRPASRWSDRRYHKGMGGIVLPIQGKRITLSASVLGVEPRESDLGHQGNPNIAVRANHDPAVLGRSLLEDRHRIFVTCRYWINLPKTCSPKLEYQIVRRRRPHVMRARLSPRQIRIQ